MWHKLQGGRLCLDFPEFCLRGMTPDFLRSVPSKMLHFFSHYFTARFISCSDTFVSIYPRLPLSYHESALDPKELQHFCCFNQHFPMVFPWFSHGFPNVFPFSYGFPIIFPWFSHFPMVFPMVFAHFVVLRGRLWRQNFGDLSEDASMAAVVADLAQITEEHPYLTLGPGGKPHTMDGAGPWGSSCLC